MTIEHLAVRRTAGMITLRTLAAALLFVGCVHAHAADPNKVLRIASDDIDTLDPVQLQDYYSNQIATVIFEGLYEWDYLSNPTKPAPRTAVALPTYSSDRKTWTIKLKPGIFFTDDPAFKGKPRELVAEDYVYTYKRYLDPNLRGGGDPQISDIIVGMRDVVEAARKPGAKMNYDRQVEGLRALDKYTLQLKLTEPYYPIIMSMLVTQLAHAREVVEASGGDIQARPVGTGPYVLKEWQRGSKVVLVANPNYRTLAFPESGDPALAKLVSSMKGKKLPAIGRVEIAVIEEQPVRVLEFDRGKLDYIELRGEAVGRFVKNGELDPALAKRGITRTPYASNSVRSLYVNMDDPVIGGMDNAHVALRRAMSMAVDVPSLIRVVYNGQAMPTSQIVAPGIAGYDANAKKRVYDPAGAAALLDRFGYNKRDAQNHRLQPDGKPLNIVFTIFTGNVWREIQTLIKRDMDALGIRVEFKSTPLQDVFKEAAQGKFMINIHGRSATPLGTIFQTFYSTQPGEANESRFKSKDYDRALDEFFVADSDAARQKAASRMTDILQTYAPVMPLLYDVENAFVQPWVLGYHPSRVSAHYQYMDIAPSKTP
jgi:oligopeptide transport system substrate-binding protein